MDKDFEYKKEYDTEDLDTNDFDFDNDDIPDNTSTPTISQSVPTTTAIVATPINNPNITNDPNNFIVLNILDSDKKLPDLIKASNNLKANEELDDTKIDESTSKELVMPKLEYSALPDLESDFQLARRNLIALAKQGTSVVEDIVALARSTEHPNTYKALNETISTFAQLNKDILEIYRTKVEIEKKVGGANSDGIMPLQGGSPVQNNFFVGTTDELLAKIASAGLNTLDNMIVPVKEDDAE
jgi:hypothetical protein